MKNLQNAIRNLQLKNKLVILRSCGGSEQQDMLAVLTRGYTTVDVSLPNVRLQAQQNPQFFLKSLRLPAYLANLHYAPELLRDLLRGDLPLGQLLASCTQSYYLGEAALPQVAFLELPLQFACGDADVFLPEAACLQKMAAAQKTDVLAAVWQCRAADDAAAYVRRVLQRDIMERTTVSDEVKFYRFLRVAASMCGGIVNYAGLAANVGVTAPTVKQWLRFLVGAGAVYLLQSVTDIPGKRLVKAPKLYFKDTGVAAHLLQLHDLAALAQSVYFKNLLENYTANAIRESFLQQGEKPELRFYKDSNNKEINLLLVWRQKLYPVYITPAKFYARKLAKSLELMRAYAEREGWELQAGCVFTLDEGCAPATNGLWQAGIGCL